MLRPLRPLGKRLFGGSMTLRMLVLLTVTVSLSISALGQTPSIPPGPSVLVFGDEYHAANCPKLTGQSPKTMPLADAMRAGAGPCRVCAPNGNEAVGAFARNYAVAIGREREAARAATAAERKRVADESATAERKRIETTLVVPPGQSPSTIPPGPSVVVFGGEYHRPTCSKPTSNQSKTMPLADAMRSGAGPCGVCEPNKDDAIGAFARNYAVAISKETEPARVAAAAERERLAAEAAKETRRRKEVAPFVRITQAQAVAALTDAGARAKNDANAFETAFRSAIRKTAPDFTGIPKFVESSDALSIIVLGPGTGFFSAASEKVRKFESLAPPPPWLSGISIVVFPKQINAPDIEKVIVQRGGKTIAPLRTTLAPKEMVTRIGAKRMIHSGEVTYPLSAFEPGPGVTVTVIAIPASGSNITETFDALELREIQ
jgi:hypothetical protein